MTLIAIESEHRLASPAEAEAWFHAIGETRVSARGFLADDPLQIERLVDAIDPTNENSVSFDGGSLSQDAWTSLGALAVSPFVYLDVRSANASLRIWPQIRTWVHSSSDVQQASRALATPLSLGSNTLRESEVTITESSGYAFRAETQSIPVALEIFRALTEESVERGSPRVPSLPSRGAAE